MKKIILFILSIILILLSLGNAVIADDIKINSHHKYNTFNNNRFDLKNNRLFISEFNVRGIYVSGWVAGSNNKLNNLVNMVEKTVLNTMVIDIKDQQGYLSYSSDVKLAREIGACKNKISNIKVLINKLHSRGIYVIGRIVVFKDPVLARNYPEFALPLRTTKNKKEYISKNWVFPGNKEVCNYNIEIAREAIQLGFDEIQFDYIRFPALGRKNIEVVIDKDIKSELINNFLITANNNLSKYKVPLSIDVYGMTTSVKDDLGIGQNFSQLSNYVNIISPMVYPSHYSAGCYGIKIPALEPYNTVYRSIYDARKKVAGKSNINIRPWLQDFTLEHEYKAGDIKAQIKAVEELGIKEWLLWNPRSRYTQEALLPPYRINFTFE